MYMHEKGVCMFVVPADPTSESTFQESIDWLYNAYFEQGPYKVWKEKSRMLVFEKKFKIAESHSLKVNASTGQHPVPFTGVDTGEWVRRLAELSLYFLLWTEAANLRHTPELLWLIYNIMLNSNNAIKVGLQHGASGMQRATCQAALKLLQ